VTQVDDLTRIIVGKALCQWPSTQATVDLCRLMLTENIPGDFVECGVFKGAHPALMARVLQEAQDSQRWVWLFDSFEGIPEAGPRDADWPGLGPRPGVPKKGALISTKIAQCSVEDMLANMVDWGLDQSRLVIRQGWFQETMLREEALPHRIALLRLDADLYESTRVCLEALYPRLALGGVCIVDDYQLPGCRAACLEYLEAEPEGLTVINDIHEPVWWRKR
jgi:O-methyltransferase